MTAAPAEQPRLSAPCLKRLGLHCQPFAQPQDAPLYRDPILDLTTQQVWSHLQQGTALLVLTGPRGVGKSTLLQRFQSLAPRYDDVCVLAATPYTGKPDIQQAIRAQWVPFQTYQGDLDRLSLVGYLDSLLQEDRRPKLVIDDAHLLSGVIITALAELKRAVDNSGHGRLALLLMGEPGLRETCSQLEAHQGLPLTPIYFKQTPLNRDQTAAFLWQRLQHCGLRTAHALDEALLDRVHQTSNGLPSAIFPAAAEALEAFCEQIPAPHAATHQSSPSTSSPSTFKLPRLPRLKLPAWRRFKIKLSPSQVTVLAIGILLFTVAMQLSIPPAPDNGAPQPPAADDDTGPPLFKNAAPRRPDSSPAQPSLPPTNAEDPQADEQPSANTAASAAAGRQSNPDAGEAASQTDNNANGARVSSQQPPAKSAQQPRDTVTKPPEDPPDAATASTSAAPAEPTNEPASPAPAGSPDTATAARPAAGQPDPSGNGEPTPEQQPASASPPPPEPPSADWLLAQPADHYAVQVAAVSSADQAHDYIRSHDLTNAGFYRAKRGNSIFFIIVAGSHATRSAANQAIAALPRQVRASSPWVRRFSQVHADIRRGR